MNKTLLKSIREYKKQSILAPILVILEAVSYTHLDVYKRQKSIYHYVVKNIKYDDDKAKNVQKGYLPSVDETLETKKGICFDYAALMTAMLRSQGIPTKLEIGYSGSVYHAWISTWLDEKGWIDNIIKFNGKSWELIDPTLAANNDNKDRCV